MAERKVITKYYPPDFDPSKITRIKVKKPIYTKVTTMLPMSIRCNTCGEYIGRGTKFNAKKQTVEGETYLGIKIFRFFIRCKKCAAELTIKTDPKNSEYICEFGATRNYEVWKETDEEKSSREEQEKEEKQDAMKALENRTLESKREMELLEELDEMKAQASRNAEIDITQILEHNIRKQQELDKQQDEEDEKLVKEIFNNRSRISIPTEDNNNEEEATSTTNSTKSIKRLLDDDNSKFTSLFSTNTESNKKIKLDNNTKASPKNIKFSNIKVFKVQKEEEEEEEVIKPPTGGGISSLMSSYESSDEEEEDN